MLSALFGNAREVDAQKISCEIDPILIPEEQIVKSYKVVRDIIVFTNFRLIVIDKQGLTGKKQMLSSIPYKSIDSVSLEAAGLLGVSRSTILRLPLKPIKIGKLSRYRVADLERYISKQAEKAFEANWR